MSLFGPGFGVMLPGFSFAVLADIRLNGPVLFALGE